MLCLAGFLLALSSCGNRAKNYDATGTFEATEVTVTASSGVKDSKISTSKKANGSKAAARKWGESTIGNWC